MELQRLQFKNFELLATVIKKYIEDFGRLIAVVGILCTLLANLGLITYNAMDNAQKDKEEIVPSVKIENTNTMDRPKLMPLISLNNNIENKTIVKTIENMPKLHKNKNLFKIENILLFIFSIIFIPLFWKKKKEENIEVEGDNNASPDSSTNKK